MTEYTIFVAPTALEEMRRLPGHMRQRVRHTVDSLASNPRPSASKALATPNSPLEARRVRLDRWRIIYIIDEQTKTIDVLAVRKRPPYNYGDLVQLLESLE